MKFLNWFNPRLKKLEFDTIPSLRAIPGSEGYTFCEATTATGASRWHIRKLDASGRKLGGGVTTESFCGHVKPFPGVGGWDLRVPISEHNLGLCCSECVQSFRRMLQYVGQYGRFYL